VRWSAAQRRSARRSAAVVGGEGAAVFGEEVGGEEVGSAV
jgi:hypothetical protein